MTYPGLDQKCLKSEWTFLLVETAMAIPRLRNRVATRLVTSLLRVIAK